MNTAPAFLRDANDLLSQDGFATSNTWYHGTSAALLDSIKQYGLKRSGDKAMRQAAKQTMATIGNNYTESIEPVFLTQSKELAYYWAERTVRERSVRISGNETPVVLSVSFTEELNAGVKPDVGAASLLLVKEGENFMAFLAQLYEQSGYPVPSIDLMKADRLEYLLKLGMAYYNKDIAAEQVTVILS